MKKLTSIMMFAAAAAATLVSCNKEIEKPEVPQENEGIKVVINTGAPETKTYVEGTTPKWKGTDAIGVFTGSDDINAKFTNTKADGEAASFSGSLAAAGTYYAYYPYSTDGANDKGALVKIPEEQHPTPTSFDGAADILLSEALDVTTTGTQSIDARFKRLGAFLKFNFTDGTTGKRLEGEHATLVSVIVNNADATKRPCPSVRITPAGIGTVGSSMKTIKAIYDADVYELTASGQSTWFGVLPQTFTNGSTFSISITTDSYSINKTLTLSKDVELLPGRILPINVSLTDVDVTKTVKLTKIWGNYGVAGVAGWPAYVSGAEDLDTKLRNACFDDDYVYIPKTDATSSDNSNFDEASIFMFNVSDGKYAGKVQRTTDPDYMAGTWASTFPVSCARVMKNTDPSINSGKDILICTNLGDGQNVRLYAWENGINNQPRLLTNFANGRRFGDRISIEGTYQNGRVWYRSYSAGMTAYIKLSSTYSDGFNGSHAWNWVEALGTTASDDGDAMTEYTSFSEGSYGIVSSNSGKGIYLLNGTTIESTYAGYKRCFGWHAFTFEGTDYLAYLDMSGGTNLPIVTILEGKSDSLESLKATLDNKKIAARASIATSEQNDFSTTGVYATSNVGDCQVRFIGGNPYVLGMTRGGIALFKVEL